MFDKFNGSFIIAGPEIRDVEFVATIESIKCQDMLEWECLLFVADPPSQAELIALSDHSPRFRLVDGDQWNLWSQMRSDLAIHVMKGTRLVPGALRTITKFARDDIALFYGDSTSVTRPDWSPIRYQSHQYFGDVVAIPRPEPLRTRCVRIPVPLSEGSTTSFASVPRAVSLAKAGSTRDKPLTSIDVVIPTAGFGDPASSSSQPMVLNLVNSLGQHRDVRIIVVIDSLAPTTVEQELSQDPNVTVIHFDEEFNFAKKCNQGAAFGDSDIVFFLNDDTISLTVDWPAVIRNSLEYKCVAAVGGLLLDREGRVQSAGHGNHPVPHLFGSGFDPEDPSRTTALAVTREVSGLSGACLAVKRSAFEQVGGMWEALPNNYNDVDLGFKLLMQGWSLLFEPGLKFTHFESATREPKVNPFELELISNRWGRFFEHDPFTPS